MRALFQSAAFVALIVGASVYHSVFPSSSVTRQQVRKNGVRRTVPGLSYSSPAFPVVSHNNNNMSSMTTPLPLRRVEALQSCDDIDKADPKWLSVFLALGVLYMFLALAIVCDEFFVPALEEMASSRRLNLSMDVAGATLMAAGGSAPELFSSLFGTFQESEIGFGTIIGSAVFNVLFVIAMCSVFAKEVLVLTWWPLFRDSLCYAIGLVVLAIFVGVVSKDEIELWEALVLFSLYIVYCLIMWKNAAIYRYLTGKELEYPDSDDDEDESSPLEPQDKNDASRDRSKTQTTLDANGSGVEVVDDDPHPPEASVTSGNSNPEDVERPVVQVEASSNRMSSGSSIGSTGSSGMNLRNIMVSHKPTSYFSWQGTFRAGILKLLRDPSTWVETAGVGIVSKIAGDADVVFQQIDENGDGTIDKEELKHLFDMLEHRLSPTELDEVFAHLDEDSDGVIDAEEFNKWYTTSAELIRSQVKHVFDELDADNSGTIDKYELKALLLELDPRVTDADCEAAIEDMYKHGSRDEITFDEFEEWYEHSMIYERQKKAVEEDMQGVWESLKPPFGDGYLNWFQFVVVFPLVLVMAITIPDVRRPGWGKWCYMSFIISICWIGLFSFLMVDWADTIGNTIGIPSVIMGLTVLAAGTSVPDLLSSVIVARRGSGDMAVSSSIGSNIFDILVGLPIPWIMYTAWPDRPDTIHIGSENIFVSLFILIAMLVFVITAVHCQGWKLTKRLGAMMIVFYVGFLIQAILLELPFETCTNSPPT